MLDIGYICIIFGPLGCISLTAGFILLYLSRITPGWQGGFIGLDAVALIVLCIPLFNVGVHTLRKARKQKVPKKN